MNRSVRYSLARITDCTDHEGQKIAAFTVRTTDGTDETFCAKRAEAKGTGLTEELIRFSLVSYETANSDGVSQVHLVNNTAVPFEAFDKWSTKVRNLVIAAWKKLSVPDELEMADFFASATDVA